MTDVSVLVVGAGFWAREMHLPALAQLPGVRIAGVVATSEASAAAAAGPYGATAWTDLDRALEATGADVVDVVAPPDVHRPAVEAAARHGRHAICIKPLARSLDEADAMLAAVRAAGTRLFYAENVPFIPALHEARRVVDAGQIGDVFRVKACEGIGEPHSSWFFDPGRSGGGAIIDMAVHSIAFCAYFAGAPVTSVYADADTYVWRGRTDAEDTAVLTLRFANGVLGQCEDSWSLTGAMDSRFEIFGTGGRVLIDNLHRQPLQVAGAGGWSYPLPLPGLVADGHLAMLGHFVDCLRTGAPSRSEGTTGRDMLAVVDAAVRSVASGRRENVHSTVPQGGRP
ncbi:Gfo/Idh/MocA family protein [Paractinoplanes globisporus]|uniref:Gfo/Idh/MocA family protein n=1 Tax=Paractinoplanes globisporus TaxID=113565 RepID=A0ABW6WLX9_9ACTN|nr:Gfo/Idh/MocA family oxidoreductase [Actinoplanes globisporus]